MSKHETVRMSLSQEWWDEENSGVSFPCACCGESVSVQLRLARTYRPPLQNEKKVELRDSYLAAWTVGITVVLTVLGLIFVFMP